MNSSVGFTSLWTQPIFLTLKHKRTLATYYLMCKRKRSSGLTVINPPQASPDAGVGDGRHYLVIFFTTFFTPQASRHRPLPRDLPQASPTSSTTS